MAPVTEKVASSGAQSGRFTRWIEENQNLAIALGVGTAVLGGAGAYYYLSGSSTSKEDRKKGNDENSGEKSAPSSKKKKKSKKKTHKEGVSNDGSAAATGDGAILDEANDEDLHELSEAEIARLPQERRVSLAQSLKAAGNKAYQKRQFEEAIKLYTKAIAASPMAVFYSNRAACYSNLGRPEDVIPDCDRALAMDHAYVKALNRRAGAREQIGAKGGQEGEEGKKSRDILFQSLADFTAVAILGRFGDQSATESVERVLKLIAQSKAKDILETREPRLPSPTFVTAYLEAFRPKSAPKLPENPSQGDKTLIAAYDAVSARDYPHAFTLFNEAIEQGLSNQDLEAAAYNMRGTFK